MSIATGTSFADVPATPVALPGMIMMLSLNILVFVGIFSLGPALPAIQAQFAGHPRASLDTQLVAAIGSFAFALTLFFMGRSIERFGYKTVLIGGLLLFSVAGLAGALTPNPAALILSRAVVGVATALILNATLVALGTIIPEDRRGRILGLQTAIGCISGILLFPAVGMLSAVDWRLPLLLTSVGLIYIPLALTLPAAHSPAPLSVPAETEQHARLSGISPTLLLAIVVTGTVMFIVSAFGSLYLAAYGVHNAFLLSLPSMSSTIGATAGALGYTALHKRLSLSAAFGMAMIVMAAGLAIAGLSHGGVMLFSFGILLAGIGNGIFNPNLNAAAIQAARGNPSRNLSTVNGLLYASLILFPLIAGQLTQFTGLGGLMLTFAAPALLLALGFAAQSRRRA